MDIVVRLMSVDEDSECDESNDNFNTVYLHAPRVMNTTRGSFKGELKQ